MKRIRPKHYGYGTTLLAGFFLFLSVSRHSPAGTTSGVRLSGHVTPTVQTQVFPSSRTIPTQLIEFARSRDGFSIDLAEIISQDNMPGGYQIYLSSTQGGVLGETIYQAIVDSQPIPLTREGVQILNSRQARGGRSPTSLSAKKLKIQPLSKASSPARKRADTLILSIVAE